MLMLFMVHSRMEPNPCRMQHARVVRTVDAAQSGRPALSTDLENVKISTLPDQPQRMEQWRQHCGCIRTSDKLKQILKNFPAPPPPSPTYNSCVPTRYYHKCNEPTLKPPEPLSKPDKDETIESPKLSSKSMQIVYELVQLLQLSVTATALALYYLIYCYMQLVYFTLRSALYFHNADGPMKITIGVVTITSLVVGFNLLIRIEKMIGFF